MCYPPPPPLSQDHPFNPNDLNIKAYVLEILGTMKVLLGTMRYC